MKMQWFLVLAVAGWLTGSAWVARAQQPAALTTTEAKAAPAEDTAQMLKRILDGQRSLENKLADLQKRLDSVSAFLGDQRASSYDSVDRRLRNIEDDLKDIKRDVNRN